MPFAAFVAAPDPAGACDPAWRLGQQRPARRPTTCSPSSRTYDRAKLTGASNMTRHSDPVIDDLLARGAATMDDEEREAIWREAVAYYADRSR